MDVLLGTPDVSELDEVVAVLREWQREDLPLQLHPGDLGWFRRLGPEQAAAATRTWSRGGDVVAIGLLDGPGLVRLTIAPELRQDEELARALATDLTRPDRGVLDPGEANVEAPMTARLQERLADEGWGQDEPWTPLRRLLSDPVEDPGLRIEAIGPDQAEAWSSVVHASFDGSRYVPERWHAMAAGSAYAEGRSLLAFDEHDVAVAAVAVWSAGQGVPGLLEPMGVHRDHRGRGHGRAISLAAAAALRDLGSSSALVCTPSANVGAVATYRAAGFVAEPEVRDRRRAG